MTRKALSDASLRSLDVPKIGQVDVWDTKLASFGVRISQGGSKTFVVKISNTRITLGRYGIITLAEARTEAKRLLAEKTLGKVRPQSITFPDAFDVFLAEKEKSRRARTIKDYKRLINLHFPFKGQLADIKHSDIERRLLKIKARSEHNHALQNAKTFFTWAHKRRYISDNPTIGFSQHKVAHRARVLTDSELQCLWKATETPTIYHTIIRLLILTGQRKGEIAALRPEYYSHNQQTICLPSEVTKNGREHTFPCGELTELLIQAAIGSTTKALIFPARGTGASPFQGWSKSKVAIDKASGVSNWRVHDIRRSFRTIHGRIKTPPHIAERLVNHISAQTDVEIIYDQHKYLSEMREAMDNYEQYLLKLFG
ncbi:integrase family protein [Bradyrhizobium sp. AUGA SZCCT0431]|uniref:integrase family protein n=1 Tax=Bradyrhizobium sp. AUGA SZCCT0431 TaxID=2807674 RepID=UPI001BACE2DB|nr:integrase family protein [Bradyrhizobium sp. AUGA SZCCT0431]MBR1146697.1 integrase family protein [Bradyrhizobium sp. AUGA SZCCT0431]